MQKNEGDRRNPAIPDSHPSMALARLGERTLTRSDVYRTIAGPMVSAGPKAWPTTNWGEGLQESVGDFVTPEQVYSIVTEYASAIAQAASSGIKIRNFDPKPTKRSPEGKVDVYGLDEEFSRIFGNIMDPLQPQTRNTQGNLEGYDEDAWKHTVWGEGLIRRIAEKGIDPNEIYNTMQWYADSVARSVAWTLDSTNPVEGFFDVPQNK